MSLTSTEHRALALSAELSSLMQEIIGDGPSCAADIREATTVIHAIQHMIMAQSAARAHPDMYRLLSGLPGASG